MRASPAPGRTHAAEAFALTFAGGALFALGAAAAWLGPPLALDSRDVLVLAVAAAGLALAALARRKLNGAFGRTM